MYQSTAEFGNLVQQDSRTFKCLITYDKVSITTVKSIKFTGGSEGGDDFSLGSAMSQYVEVTVPDKNYLLEGKEILLQIGMAVNGKMEYIPVGYFTVGKPKKSDNQITFTAYDRMMKTERLFSMNGSDTNTVSVLKRVAEITGITVITTGLTAVSMKVPKGYSCREVLCYVAQLHGAFAVCNRKGQIELHTYKDSGYGVNPGRYWESFEHNEYTFDVSKLECYTGKDKDGNSISISAGSGARAVTFSNPFMTQTALNSVQASLQSFSYMPGKLKMLGDPRLDPWDILTIKDLAGKSYKVPIMKLEWEYDGGLTYSVEAVGLSEEETNSDYKGPQTKEMERYYAQLVMIDRAMINKLDVDTANITYATIKNLDVVKEHVQEITGELGEFKDLTAANFKAANAQIEILNGNYANIKTLMSGGAGIGDIQNIHLTTKNAVIDSALIRSAVIETVAVSDLLAGTISTNKFTIASDDGGIRIQGATQQWSDANGIVRMQAGRDANGDFTFSLFDKTGKGVLIDSTGIKENAITDGLIVNKMVADNAGIAGSKLDIPSVVSEINGSTETIKSSRIWFDEEKQTLSQLYSKTAKDIETAQKKADSASDVAKNAAEGIQTTNQNVASIKTGLDGMDLKLSETTSELYGLKEGTLLYNCTYHDNGDNTTTVTAVVYRAGKDVTKEFPESCYTWKRKTEAGERALGSGYSITVNNNDYTFGGVVVGQFETDDDTQTALLTMQEGVVQINGKAVAFNGKNDFVDANSFAESKTVPEEKKLLFVDAETNEGGNITAGNFKKQILSNLGTHDIRVDDRDTRLDEVLDKVQYDATKGKHRQLGKACLWYHNFYDFGQNDDEAAAVIAQNEIVVAGGTLYAGSFTEEDKKRQLGIIAKARALNPDLKIFYYITIASWRRDGDWSHILGKGGYWDEEEASKHPGAVRIHTKWEIFQLLEYAAHIGGTKSGKREFIETYIWTDDNGVEHTEDKYVDLYEGGISLDGCFYDDAGMETEEGRINQGFPKALREKYIQLVNYTHGKGLAAFPNQLSEDWYADTVSTANPNGLPSSIGPDDYMLLESTHSQVGFQKRPLWRHVNGTESVWNYYQNWYDKIGAKVVINDYLYGTGVGEGLTDEEFYELATYLVCDSFCCGAHYIDLNGLLTWSLPRFFSELLIPENEEYNVTRVEKGHYKLYANGHTLEVIRSSNLAQGDTVTIKSLNKVYIYLDGIRIKNMFKDVSQYMYETDDRLDAVEKDVEVIQTSSKSTANIYHRMMIDDWNKELILTNYVATREFIKNLESTASKGIATVDMVDYNTNSIRLTRLNSTQINEYLEIDITDKKGHTFEIGFTVREVTNGNNWGFNTYNPAVISWTNIRTSLNTIQKSSFYGDNFYGYIRTIKIPEDTEEETWKMRICFNGSAGEVFELSNFYVVDTDEYGEDITKDWYTNLIPSVAINNNGLKICYTVEKSGDYDFDITWNDPDNFAKWSGLRWDFPNGTFKAGHTYELGFTTYENNSGSANVAFRISWPSGGKWLPKTSTIKSSIYGDTRPGCIFTVPESATTTNGNMTFTNTAGTCINSSGEYFKTSIRGMYLYDVNEEDIVIRGQEPSNSFLRICRVTEEKLAKDTTLIGNSLYMTDEGNMFVTDFNGKRVDITRSGESADELRLLPIPTAQDEGKTLKVINGQWKLIEPASVDIKAALKENLALDIDEKFIYLRYGTEELSKVSLENNREPDGIEINIAKGSSWFNSNNMPGLGGNAARAYSYVGSVAPAKADTTYSYGALLQKGTKYKIRSAASECYYGLQIYSSATKIRVLDSGWQAPGTEYAYTPAEENLYLYINFKYGTGGSATITDEILSKLTEGFSITTES